MRAKNNFHKKKQEEAFTLVEVMVTVAIVGTLSAIALPKFVNQICKTKQYEAKATIAEIMTHTAAYNDEYGLPATGWSDLDEMASIMTSTGSATGSNFSDITLPGKEYKLNGEITNNKYIFSARCVGSCPSHYNVIGCINVATGASNIQLGKHGQGVLKSDLTCP